MSNVATAPQSTTITGRIHEVVLDGKVGRKLNKAHFEAVESMQRANAIIRQMDSQKNEAKSILDPALDTYEFGTWKNIKVVTRVHVKVGPPTVDLELLKLAFPEAFEACTTPFKVRSHLKV